MTIGGFFRADLSAKIILLLMTLALPIVVYGAIMALGSTSNDPRQWLPRGFAETETYDWFGQQFGTDELAVVSWPGCTLDDPRVAELAVALQASEYFDEVRSGQSVLGELTDSRAGLSRRSAIRRLQGILIGPDAKSTCLLLSTSAIGRADRPAAIGAIQQLAAASAGLTLPELRMAGPTVDAAAIDIESRRLLFQLAGLSALVSFLVAALRLGSVTMALTVLSVAGYSTLLTLALLYFSGGKMNLLMTMLPPLIYVLSISAAVHLANYYRDALVDAAPAIALRKAISHGWVPCTMAAVTTAVGLASLLTSSIDPIREFGAYSALGVVVSVAILFLMFPAAVRLLPVALRVSPSTVARRTRRGSSLIRIISAHPLLVTTGCAAVMLLCGSGLWRIKSTVRLQDRFLESSDLIADYRWLESQIGPMVPLEIALHFATAKTGDHNSVGQDNAAQSSFQRMQLVAAVQAKIRSLGQHTATMSAVNLSPPLPTGHRVADVVERKMINSEQTKQRLIDSHFLSESADEQLWRISVRANAIGETDYGEFAEALRSSVDPILAEHGVRGTYTGIIPLIYKAQRQLLSDLFGSFMAAFGVIALILVFMLRSPVAAMLAMIPNLFPAIVVFGAMEWISIPVQIGSVMTASAALGIAVDDTVHFLTWFRADLMPDCLGSQHCKTPLLDAPAQ